jgi:nucleoside-diphosphate-sugar epimerase
MSVSAERRRVVVTGAAGGLGRLARAHLEKAGRYDLVLLDVDPGDDAAIGKADLSRFSDDWVALFEGARVVVHLAADARPWAPWSSIAGNNVQATINVYRAARHHRVERVVFTSSLQTMEGYRFGDGPIGSDTDPRPTTLYAVSKLVGEMIARQHFDQFGLSSVCLRVGFAPGTPPTAAQARQPWAASKWLSPNDFCQAIEAAVSRDDVGFAILPLTSKNAGMRWDLSETERILGYAPRDGLAMPRPRLLERWRESLTGLRRRRLDSLWRQYGD